MRVGSTDFLHDAGAPAQQSRPDGALTSENPLEARRYLGRGHRASVVEPRAVPYRKCPCKAVARPRPASGEGGIHVGSAFAIGNKGVEYLPSDQRTGTVDRGGGIERGRDAGDADAEFLASLRGRGGREYDEKREKEHETRQ